MANFFLIDHSLKDASGHHADYAECIGQAANQMGFLTTLATNRRLPRRDSAQWAKLKKLGPVRAVFRNSTYQPTSYLAGLRQMKRTQIDFAPIDKGRLSIPGLKRRFQQIAVGRKRVRHVRQFASDCEKFFRNTLLTPNDHAFFATVSELDLMGLAEFLANQPRTMQVHWHLQFHFNLFEGRPPEYEQQSLVTKAVRGCFLSALARLSYHSIKFYATSDELAYQYAHLDVGDFETLPYPIAAELIPTRNQFVPVRRGESVCKVTTAANGSMGPDNRRDRLRLEAECREDTESAKFIFESQPVKIVCPGSIRREKGQRDYLQSLVGEIWEPYLRDGLVQLVLQRPDRGPLQKSKLRLLLPGEGEHECAPPVVYHVHPLSRRDYIKLIQSTDIGLLMYDSRVYYSRRTGVLGELLACGKPVIVPAGSWLAEQIKEPIFDYADKVVAGNETRQIGLSELHWESCNVPMSGGVLSFDRGVHPFNFELETDSTESVAVMYFDWHWPCEPGVYCRIEMSQFDGQGVHLGTVARAVGHREIKKCNALFTIETNATRLRFSLTNAFHHSTATIKNVEIVTARGVHLQQSDAAIPLGSVGVIAADRHHLGECVREIVENLDHYRQSAQEFSSPWYAKHNPKRALAHLISTDYSDSRTRIA